MRDSITSLRPAPAPTALLASVLWGAFLPAVARADDLPAADGPQIVVNGDRPDEANPNADSHAPYKVEKSADGRFTEPLRDTPKSITVIPRQVIEDQGATSFRELARTTPGVTLGTGEGGNAFGDRIFIRGFEARNDVYIDGQRDPGVSSREIFAVEQVEIVKGPSAAYFGRGTTGGSVGLESKKAKTGSDFVTGELTGGTSDMLRATVDANYRLGEGAALRVNALYHTGDTPGRDHVGNQRWGASAALTWNLSPALSLEADYYYFRADGMSDYGHPFDLTTHQPYKVDPDNFYGAVGRDFNQNAADIGTAALEWRPSESVKLRSQTRYGEVSNRYVVSVPRAPRVVTNSPADLAAGFVPGQLVVDTGTAQRNATTDYLGNITTLNLDFATGAITHEMVLGGELSREKVTNLRYAFPTFVENANGDQIGTPAGFTRDLFDPDPVLGYAIPALVDTSVPPATTKVYSWSLFGLDTLKFGEKWQLLLGLRYDTFDIHARGVTRGTPYDVKSGTDFLNYQASLLYKPAEAVSLYASFATSANPSGEQLDSTSPDYGGVVGVQNLTPEHNKAWELGGKWEAAGGHLLLTAAAFRIDKTDARENQGGGVYVDVGKLRSQGFELGVSGNLTSRLALFGGYTFLDARIVASADPAQIGSRFANVPRYSFSLLANYAFTERLMFGAQATSRSRVHGGTLDANGNSLPGYWKFDLVGRYRVSKRLELRANVTDLTDKRYYDAIYRSGTPFSYVAPGRQATVSATVSL
ncbi:MAG: TonB-dependent receptor [Croceibacterium sp.]